MPVTIKITAGGIFGAEGEVPVGTEITLSEEPKGWDGRYVVISGGSEGKTAVTNPAKTGEAPELVAKHRGGGSYSVMRGDEEVVDKLAKDQAEQFNALSAEDKALAVEAALAEREAA